MTKIDPSFWHDARHYADLDLAVPPQFMWEWLRRDHAFAEVAANVREGVAVLSDGFANSRFSALGLDFRR
jgi:hypothetical protein